MSMNVTDGLFVRDGWLTGYGGISTLAYDLLLKNAVIIIPVAIGIWKISRPKKKLAKIF